MDKKIDEDVFLANIIEKLKHMDPTSADAYIREQIIIVVSGDYSKKCESKLRELLAENQIVLKEKSILEKNTAQLIKILQAQGHTSNRDIFTIIADEYVKRGNITKEIIYFKLAGRLYERIEAHERSGNCYFLAGNFRNAAVEFKKVHNWEKAIESYISCNCFEAAGTLCMDKLKDYPRAIELFKRANKPELVKAAEAKLKGK
ncbi:MAG: hypothetical protein WC758_05895 [Candidatus Woesearchaeota archaeon]|jgi:tetratricopeptide (TPR) repeat protein